MQDKWDKAKRLLSALQQDVRFNTTIDRKMLESIRGFFIHLQRTYPAITPFLKGLHLTIDGWREGRDADMWKISNYWRELVLTVDSDGTPI